jgi:hypothetical protein
MRNQAVGQPLALREARVRKEESDRDRRRREITVRMRPAIEVIERAVAREMPDIEQLRWDRDEQNQRDAVEPICSAIRSAGNTEFLVKRQMGVNAAASERNRERKEVWEREVWEEQDRLAVRAKKKKRNMKLGEPR